MDQPIEPAPCDAVAHLQWMLRARLLEERLSSLYRQGRIPGSVFTGRGQEALSAAIGMQLRPGDIFAPLIRDMAGRLAFGLPAIEAARTYLGRITGHMRGRDGNVHHGLVDQGMLPMISHLGAMAAPCVGILLKRKITGALVAGDQCVAVVCIGEGGMQTGAMHEAINLAAVERLPLVVVAANNGYAYSTPSHQNFVCRDLVDRALGYGLRGWSCDATDCRAAWQTVAQALAAARSGDGPQLISARLLRLAGHGEHDDAAYIDPALKAAAVDCLDQGRQLVLDQGLLDQAELAALHTTIKTEIDAAVDQALGEADPVASDESWQIFADPILAAGAGAQA